MNKRSQGQIVSLVPAQAELSAQYFLKAEPLDKIKVSKDDSKLAFHPQRPKPVFVDLLWRPGIDSQPGGPVRNPICRTGPPGYIGWRNRFLGIDSWAP